MLSLLQGIIFLLLGSKEPTSSVFLKSEYSGRVLKTFEDIPMELIISFESGNNFMDVFVPPDCIKENTALFKAFFDLREKLVTLSTDGKMHFIHCRCKTCSAFRKSLFQLVYFIYDQYDIDNLYYSLQTQYSMLLFSWRNTLKITGNIIEIFCQLHFSQRTPKPAVDT